jgi:hypothetical protein
MEFDEEPLQNNKILFRSNGLYGDISGFLSKAANIEITVLERIIYFKYRILIYCGKLDYMHG